MADAIVGGRPDIEQGCSVRTIDSLLSGVRRPSLALAVKIESALGILPRDWYGLP